MATRATTRSTSYPAVDYRRRVYGAPFQRRVTITTDGRIVVSRSDATGTHHGTSHLSHEEADALNGLLEQWSQLVDSYPGPADAPEHQITYAGRTITFADGGKAPLMLQRLRARLEELGQRVLSAQPGTRPTSTQATSKVEQ